MPLRADGSPWEAPLRRSMQHGARGLFAGVSNHNTVLALDTLPGSPASATGSPHRLPAFPEGGSQAPDSGIYSQLAALPPTSLLTFAQS